MLILHGAAGLFDEVGIIVAALAGALAVISFGAHIIESRRQQPVVEPVKIEP